MSKWRVDLLSCAFGIPGLLVGVGAAFFKVQQSIAEQLARRNWVDSTAIHEHYFLYGLVGYLISAVIGEFIYKRYQKRTHGEKA